MSLIWGKNRSLYAATPLSNRHFYFLCHVVPHIGCVRGSLDAIEEIDERLEAGTPVRCGKFEVDG
jgi:hypothetical protein